MVHGVSFKWDREYRLRRAHKIDGVLYDIIINPDNTTLVVRSDPYVQAFEGGGELLVRSRAEAQRLIKGLQRKYRSLNVDIKETITDIKLGDIDLRIDAGPDLGRLCLKMCIAALSALPTFERQHVADGRAILLGDSSELLQVRKDGRSHTAIEKLRPPLGHLIYVESRQQSTYGIVQLFGTIQIHCNLGRTGNREACALVGVVDTINDTENFELIAPLNIAEPPLLSVAGTIKEAWREKFVQQVGFYVKGFRASFGLGGRPRAALLHADTASLLSPYTLSEGSTFKLTYPLTLVNRRPAL